MYNKAEEQTELVTELLTDETEFINDSVKSGELNHDYAGKFLSGIYQVREVIGKGGGGTVYKAYHTRLDKDVVIKQIVNLGFRSSNRTEVDIIKKIKHTNLPQVLDFIEQDGDSYTVMDFIPGQDISKLVQNGRKFSQKEIIRTALQLCDAVNYLHKCSPPIIHSDIKPANIMYSENGNICLIDFNVSLFFSKEASVIGGTLGFSPPEQFGVSIKDISSNLNDNTLKRSIRPRVTERSDIYSIGSSLYFMAIGRNPAFNYGGNPLKELLENRISEPLAYIISKAMELSPAKRYKSVSEMLVAFNNMGKLDRRYRKLLVKRGIITALAVVMISGFAMLNRAGVDKLREEHEEKYLGYMQQIESSIEDEDYDFAEYIIAVAKDFEPNRIEAYFNEIKIFNDKKEYEKCMVYPDSVLTSKIFADERNSREIIAQIYEIAANAAFELEQYDTAIEYYKDAIAYSPKVVECYRDLAISYARTGELDTAEEVLLEARDRGISDDRLDLIQGEICAARGEFSQAFDNFSRVIQKTDDDYVRFRALLACDKAAIADNSRQGLIDTIALLESQLDIVPVEYSVILNEMLANEYAQCGTVLEDKEYFRKAADCYRNLMKNGNLGYQLKKNYFNILFSQMKEYGECIEVLDAMEQENDSDYWIPMSRAYVEISIQNDIKNQTKRNYDTAYKDFLIADELYQQFVQNGKSDPNMDTLRLSVNELIEYGWIKEK